MDDVRTYASNIKVRTRARRVIPLRQALIFYKHRIQQTPTYVRTYTDAYVGNMAFNI